MGSEYPAGSVNTTIGQHRIRITPDQNATGGISGTEPSTHTRIRIRALSNLAVTQRSSGVALSRDRSEIGPGGAMSNIYRTLVLKE